jgi:hypothetical protein
VAASRGGDALEAFEIFLRLEMAGWKGHAGTAILCRSADAAFARAAIPAMAAEGAAWIESLRVGGRTIAAQVLLRSGDAAFTWKIAHDQAFGQYSPGVLLVESYTEKLLADPAIAFADSCSHGEDGLMASMWSERTDIVDLAFDARRGGSFLLRAFDAAGRIEAGCLVLAKRLVSRETAESWKRRLHPFWPVRRHTGRH